MISEFFHQLRLNKQVGISPMDLVSGYILLEKKTSDRKYQTWFDQVQIALTQIGVGGSIKSLVSDRAQALIQLAVQGLGIQSLPDLFHGMRCLSRSRSVLQQISTIVHPFTVDRSEFQTGVDVANAQGFTGANCHS